MRSTGAAPDMVRAPGSLNLTVRDLGDRFSGPLRSLNLPVGDLSHWPRRGFGRIDDNVIPDWRHSSSESGAGGQGECCGELHDVMHGRMRGTWASNSLEEIVR